MTFLGESQTQVLVNTTLISRCNQFKDGTVEKKPSANAGDKTQETWIWSLVRKSPWSSKWQPAPLFFPGKSQGQRRVSDYSPWGCKESDMTQRLSTHSQFKMPHLSKENPVMYRTMRDIFIVLSTQFVILCYGSPGKLKQLYIIINW